MDCHLQPSVPIEKPAATEGLYIDLTTLPPSIGQVIVAMILEMLETSIEDPAAIEGLSIDLTTLPPILGQETIAIILEILETPIEELMAMAKSISDVVPSSPPSPFHPTFDLVTEEIDMVTVAVPESISTFVPRPPPTPFNPAFESIRGQIETRGMPQASVRRVVARNPNNPLEMIPVKGIKLVSRSRPRGLGDETDRNPPQRAKSYSREVGDKKTANKPTEPAIGALASLLKALLPTRLE
ncbi:hypothetical protein FRC01_012844 [Tulasnella sp. 417]|nr:hypothetical protein FRC01_012844 [Tulasnella sp. 417]